MRKYSLGAIQKEMEEIKETVKPRSSRKIENYIHNLSTSELRELLSDTTTSERFNQIMEGLED